VLSVFAFITISYLLA